MKNFVLKSNILKLATLPSVAVLALSVSTISQAQNTLQTTVATPLVISLTQPVIDHSNYNKPYIAVWLETPEKKGVTTISLWYEKYKNGRPYPQGKNYLPNLKTWWKKQGKHESNALIDGYSGATRVPKTHIIKWDGKTKTGKKVTNGTYILNIEARRESGGYELLRKKITLGKAGSLNFSGKKELGAISVNWQ